MGAINVQSQMLAAPTAVMAEQAVIGLVEHPEQPMTIDIANPGCRHKLWVSWQTSDVQSQRLPGPSGESVFARHPETPRGGGQCERAKPAVWPLSGVAPQRVRLSDYMATAYGVT
jgi:hypothetical protein